MGESSALVLLESLTPLAKGNLMDSNSNDRSVSADVSVPEEIYEPDPDDAADDDLAAERAGQSATDEVAGD